MSEPSPVYSVPNSCLHNARVLANTHEQRRFLGRRSEATVVIEQVSEELRA